MIKFIRICGILNINHSHEIWMKISIKILVVYHYTCTWCGISTVSILLHHQYFLYAFCEKACDLIIQCSVCVKVPMARASILWLTGEYCEDVPKISPDLLRKVAKTFTSEEDIVKMQAVNLAAKLYLTNSKQVKYTMKYTNLCHYVKLCCCFFSMNIHFKDSDEIF